MQHVKELSQAPSKVNLKQTTLNSIPNSPTKFNANSMNRAVKWSNVHRHLISTSELGNPDFFHRWHKNMNDSHKKKRKN
jgi:hypothetical protein